ncbi:MAG: helix-turn-helix domain-containing protein [Eubacteriales bacterium]|nr:helix-turn-helix domain-containing protein [Eubacteriales bacterium]
MKTIDMISKYIEEISDSYGVRINIHDIYGITHFNKELNEVLSKYLVHNNPFCDFIKRSPLGLARCIKAKACAVAKCSEDIPYRGCCYMGLGEYVYPIYFKNKVVTVLFIGEFYFDEDNQYKQLADEAKHIGVDIKKAQELFSKVLIREPKGIQEKVEMLVKLFTLFLYESDYQFTESIYSNHIVNQAISFINRNYTAQLTLELIANSCYCNASYLSRNFKNSTGTNISEYINKVRIERAKTALRFTEKSITEIAYEVGYGDTAYFSKVFKGIEGITPKKYKNLDNK